LLINLLKLVKNNVFLNKFSLLIASLILVIINEDILNSSSFISFLQFSTKKFVSNIISGYPLINHNDKNIFGAVVIWHILQKNDFKKYKKVSFLNYTVT
jgi:hypothetical protein